MCDYLNKEEESVYCQKCQDNQYDDECVCEYEEEEEEEEEICCENCNHIVRQVDGVMYGSSYTLYNDDVIWLCECCDEDEEVLEMLKKLK